jgi:hypothetical protein
MTDVPYRFALAAFNIIANGSFSTPSERVQVPGSSRAHKGASHYLGIRHVIGGAGTIHGHGPNLAAPFPATLRVEYFENHLFGLPPHLESAQSTRHQQEQQEQQQEQLAQGDNGPLLFLDLDTQHISVLKPALEESFLRSRLQEKEEKKGEGEAEAVIATEAVWAAHWAPKGYDMLAYAVWAGTITLCFSSLITQ